MTSQSPPKTLRARIAELERQAAQKKAEQWQPLLGGAEELRSFLEENRSRLKLKEES